MAFSAWGFLPIYWKLLDTVPSLEILAHRMVWSVLFLVGLLAVQKRLGEFRDLLKTPKYIWMLLGTAVLLGVNWFVYIYGVNTNQIVETSLGYFINPLFNVLLGAIFLKERLNYWQSLALGMAALGVLNFLWDFDSLPWIALSLAFTFSFYGLLRKMIPVKPLVGLLMETVLLAPFAAVMIVVWNVDGTGNIGGRLENCDFFSRCRRGHLTTTALVHKCRKTTSLYYPGFYSIHDSIYPTLNWCVSLP